MSHSKPAINVKSNMKYKEEYDQYTFQLCHKRNYWWLLLLLLPLLLFIKCSKDITVTCMDGEGNFPIESQSVQLDYSAHYLYNDGKFLASDSISIIQKTDTDGSTTFEDLPCSVFSYLFYCLQEATFSVESECYKPIIENHNFHYNRQVTLKMEPFRKDLYIKLLDRETRDELPDGKLIYRYIDNNEEKTDSVEADAAGVVRIPQMRYCSSMTEITGCCYGYEDETRKDVLNKNLVSVCDSTTLLLRPIMERFTFFAKNNQTTNSRSFM